MRHFEYIKQNSIAEIVSTVESFLGKGYKKDIFAVLLTDLNLTTLLTVLIVAVCRSMHSLLRLLEERCLTAKKR